MGPIYTWQDFLDMTRRRLGVISFVIILGCVASLYWALSHVHLYSSSEVIQVEQPKINDELARSTVEGSSARRLQLIQQQLMARASLQDIIEKYDIYANLEALKPSEKVNLLRQSVTINGVAAAREGFADDGTISVLTITAQMEQAQLARDVAHEFAEQTRNLMAAQRREQTEQTLTFFQQQETVVLANIADLEAELEVYRRENDLTGEGGVEFRLAEIAQLNEAILGLDREIITAQLARTQIDRSARASTVQREERALDAQLQTLTQQRSLLDQRRTALRETIQGSPEIQRSLADFDRRMEQLRNQLEEIATRRNEAQVGFNLETAAQGERLKTIEEAQVPDYPITMSKKKRAIMGAAASVVLAFAIAWLLELRRPVIRSARQMKRETGVMPVVSIPELAPKYQNSKWRKAREKRRAAGKAGRASRLARHS
ncbi:chain-length determining protein [Sulfitobacter donghicola]|uniref:Chain-length determining protein n=2 Tax=Sulfitobacter TaxID=60136 RepID=A0A073IHK2_9RHOB|nr:chain-length determining protein [Sulfitobacter donghicola]KEJ89264.1 chain-length determining protein [Sulfitobacter donghicola DSW-25 = KCTC 12864 = JCM 14565]KIN69061.1 Lipopolysaccharide biosynthesis [Sulfitobacter donghicola DSW-25 = KCTC 12864 = JCM 14565]